MLPLPDFDQMQELFRDPMQRRYAIIRPLVLCRDRTATQRAAETHTPPATVGTRKRRFEQQGMLGLFPDSVEILPSGARHRVPDTVVQELARLKGLDDGLTYRERGRIIYYTLAYRIGEHTVKRLWQQRPVTSPPQLPLLDSHSYPERSQARCEVMQLSVQGWSTTSISRFWHVSRPTINAWIGRFERDNLASLEDKGSAPKTPSRKVWLPVMREMDHLHKRHPDAGGFRMGSLRGTTELSVRTVERIMAVNRQVYDDIPHVGKKRQRPTAPGLHPFKAACAHEYWFIDGRIMDCALDGVKWWSLIVLDGSSRTMLAGAVAPTAANWVALMVLYTACVRSGAPEHLLSDRGGAVISKEVEAVCMRLGMDHHTMTSPQGESYMHLMETPCNIQRRLYDSQFSLARTPVAFEQAHQDVLQLYNTTAHQGLRKEQCKPPIPLEGLGEARGRLSTPDELARKFSRALFPRITNRYGCVTLHRYHFSVAEGLPKTQVLLWVYGNALRAVFDNVVLALYHCRYDLRDRKVTDRRDGSFPPTRFASTQGSLLPINPPESLILYRPKPLMRQARLLFPAQQLWLFERVETA